MFLVAFVIAGADHRLRAGARQVAALRLPAQTDLPLRAEARQEAPARLPVWPARRVPVRCEAPDLALLA